VYAKQSPLTLTHFILSTTRRLFPEATGEFAILMNAIESATKFISSKVRAAGIMNLHGEDGTVNVQGEHVKKLDTLSNEAMVEFLRRSTVVSLMVSEEDEQAIPVPEHPKAKYVVAFDPLDGSSNIDVNVTIGTIFSIFKKRGPADQPATVDDILQCGKNLVAAGYVMYGSATVLVLATAGIEGVNGFTLDPSTGEYVLTQAGIRTKDYGRTYSVNQGNWKYFADCTKRYVTSCMEPKSGGPFSLRYVGSMIGDVHRTILYGGIFMYPADERAERGKLRLLYEVMPMSFVMHKAGGSSSDGYQSILDVVPTSIHERCPCFIGSKRNIEELEACYKA
jgi:fructose-1,6-bisphosphatase I